MSRISPSEWQPVEVPSLEEAADEAVRIHSNTLVVAGPGAGKTELLAQRACFLLQTGRCSRPKRILAIAFKRDAAKNLDERVTSRCVEGATRFDSLTLDAFAKGLVDRFRKALPKDWRPRQDYKIMLRSFNDREMRNWLGRVALPDRMERPSYVEWTKTEIKEYFDRCTHGYRLPYSGGEMSPLESHLGLVWWRQQIDAPATRPSLTFPMLNRLAAFILRENPLLLRALRQTFAFVFLDEFQDTTASQYDLIRAAFEGSASILTAVGDPKQRIMMFAGALREVLPSFEQDFSAKRLHLLRNYRSLPKLVEMQHSIASAIDPSSPKVQAAKSAEVEGKCFIMEFLDAEQEARAVAEIISTGLTTEGLQPRDFCVLVRQRTPDMIMCLDEEMRKKDMRIRDESELQDLLTEPVTNLLLAILRLATSRRDPEAWEVLTMGIAFLGYSGEQEDIGHRIEHEAKGLVESAEASLSAISDVEAFSSEDLFQGLVQQLGEAALQSTYHQYSQSSYLDDTVARFCSRFDEAVRETGSVQNAITDILGGDIVPAMTIHKSKGLEFHTVVFLGLEDSSWWAFQKQSDEERRSFFVAFSRAIERVVFTFSDVREGRWGRRRQARSGIEDLYAILKQAGVPTHNLRERAANFAAESLLQRTGVVSDASRSTGLKA